MARQTVCLDFDGVVHLYKSGWQGAVTAIVDPPTAGVRAACDALMGLGYDVVVYSTRCSDPAGRRAIEDWLRKHDIRVTRVADKKPPAVLYVDDRGYRFDGDWEALLAFVTVKTNMVPWQNRGLTSKAPMPTLGKTLIEVLAEGGLRATDDEVDAFLAKLEETP